MTRETTRHPGIDPGESHGSAHAEAEDPLFGFWMFLMSDAVVFALLLATYVTMTDGLAGGPGPKQEFHLVPTFIETMALLLSSFTHGMASLSLKHQGGTVFLLPWLLVTLLLGVGFLVLEGHDFAQMIGEGATPARSGFLSAFFTLLATHGLHVLAGCVWILVMVAQIAVHGLDKQVRINLLRLGLFWHFLDIVWVAIFSVVHLRGLLP